MGSQPAQTYWEPSSNAWQFRSILASKSDHARQVINGTEPARATHSFLETLQPALIRAGCIFIGVVPVEKSNFRIGSFLPEPLERKQDHFRGVLELQLFFDAVFEGTDGRQRHIHFLRNFPGALALAQHSKDFQFAVAECLQWGRNLAGLAFHKL